MQYEKEKRLALRLRNYFTHFRRLSVCPPKPTICVYPSGTSIGSSKSRPSKLTKEPTEGGRVKSQTLGQESPFDPYRDRLVYGDTSTRSVR